MYVYLDTASIARIIYYDGEGKDVLFNEEDYTPIFESYPEDTIFRMLGGPSNTLLLCEMRRILTPEKWQERLQLMSPHRKEVRGLEEAILFAVMSNLELPESTGGWRPVTEVDYHIARGFEFCRFADKSVSPSWNAMARDVRDQMCAPIQEYAFFKKIQFASQSVYDLISVIGLIGDPRWFYQPDSEDGQPSLYSYFGVDPETYVAYVNNPQSSYKTYRLGVLIDAWNARPEGTQRKTFIDDYLAAKNSADPKYILRACQIFLDFVRGVWLSELSSPEFFAPDLFFRNPSHAQDFKDYCVKLEL